MSGLSVKELSIPGVFLIEPPYSEDGRGCFYKVFVEEDFAAAGLPLHCSEEFFSVSKRHVIRGMHFQSFHPQIKLVQVLAGAVYDVVVDLREDSPCFGKWTGIELSAENRRGLYIPRGCAHGFLALRDGSMMRYLCDGRYDKDTDTGISYCDPEIGVEWPLPPGEEPIVGERDRRQMSFEEFRKSCRFVYDTRA